MPGNFSRAFSVVVFVLFFAEPSGGGPPAPADSLKYRPPRRADGSSSLERLKGLRQRLLRKRDLEKEHAMIRIALESLLVPRSPLDNMPLVNPGSGFTYNMPIARPDPGIDYKLRIPGSPSVPYQKEPITPQSRRFKRK